MSNEWLIEKFQDRIDELVQQLSASEAKYEAARDRKNSITLLQQQLAARDKQLAEMTKQKAVSQQTVMDMTNMVGHLEGEVYNLSCELSDCKQQLADAVGLLQCWNSLDGESWHQVRYQNSKAELERDTETFLTTIEQDKEND